MIPHPATLWKSFVDDICMTITLSLLESFHSHLNSIESLINFTYELEDQQKLPFFDLLIKHQTDEHSPSQCIERRHVPQILSVPPPLAAHKLVVVRTLHSRASTHCRFASDGLVERKQVSHASTDEKQLHKTSETR